MASATSQFQKDHPGWTVDVQYQNWGDHLQKFDATLAGGNTADVIEMGNTEMTKYMAAGAFADITSFKGSFANSSSWLKGLAASGTYGGKLFGVPYYAGSRVVTYRKDAYEKAGITKLPTSLAEFIELAKREPGKLNYGSAGPGTIPHLAGELFCQVAGVRLTPVHYRGATPALSDVMGGHTNMMLISVSSAGSQRHAFSPVTWVPPIQRSTLTSSTLSASPVSVRSPHAVSRS